MPRSRPDPEGNRRQAPALRAVRNLGGEEYEKDDDVARVGGGFAPLARARGDGRDPGGHLRHRHVAGRQRPRHVAGLGGRDTLFGGYGQDTGYGNTDNDNINGGLDRGRSE